MASWRTSACSSSTAWSDFSLVSVPGTFTPIEPVSTIIDQSGSHDVAMRWRHKSLYSNSRSLVPKQPFQAFRAEHLREVHPPGRHVPSYSVLPPSGNCGRVGTHTYRQTQAFPNSAGYQPPLRHAPRTIGHTRQPLLPSSSPVRLVLLSP